MMQFRPIYYATINYYIIILWKKKTLFKTLKKNNDTGELVTMNEDEIENTDFYVIVPSEKNKEIKLGFQKSVFWCFSLGSPLLYRVKLEIPILKFGILRVQLIMVLFFGYPVRFTTFDRYIQLVHTGRPIWNTTKVNWDFGAFHTNDITSFLKFERKKNQKYSLNSTYDMNTLPADVTISTFVRFHMGHIVHT